MAKAQLRAKLIDFQRRLLDLTREVDASKKRCLEAEEALFLELLGVLDAFENVFANLENKEISNEKSVQRALKSFYAIQRKLLRILGDRGVTQIKLADNKAQMGLCHIMETRVEPGQEEGTVLTVIKQGYFFGEKIIRPVEVVTVANQESESSD